jgi:tRNA nucleotidyltransferase/poly(A) polymerase
MPKIPLTEIIPKYKPLREVIEKTGAEVYLVGGTVRDFILKRKSTDFDFTVFRGDPKEIADKWSKVVRGTLVILDEDEKIYRVVSGGYEYDFADPKGENPESDAKKRDFTINTLSADMSQLKPPILDFAGGVKDIKRKIIRATYDAAFSDDPLRLLRAFRFMSEFSDLKFKIDKSTLDKISSQRELITGVAAERIRDEIAKLFSSDKCYGSVYEMDGTGLLSSIFPEVEKMRGVAQNRFHTEDVWGHSLLCLKNIESIARNPRPFFKKRGGFISDYLEKPMGAGWRRSSLLKLVALFHDVGKPDVKTEKTDGEFAFYGHENIGAGIFKEIGKRILMNRKGQNFAATLIKNHMRLLSLATADRLTKRAIARLIRDVGEDLPALMLLGIADTLSGHTDRRRLGRSVALIREIFSVFDEMKQETFKIKPLIDGSEIMEAAGIGEGTEVGRLKSELVEAQIAGEVKTKGDAKWFVKKMARNI